MGIVSYSEIEYHGRIRVAPAEMPGRIDEFNENRVASTTFCGKYDDVREKMDAVRRGDSMSTFDSWSDSKFNKAYCVRTMTLTRTEGDVGELHVTFVKCPNGKDHPYNKVWEVGMEEVQKKLITHPYIVDHADRGILLKWEETPSRYKVDQDGEFWYATGEMDGDMPELVKIEKSAEKKYCEAVMAGIETYNLYLPVVSCTSFYIIVPGVLYNGDGVLDSGNITMEGDEVGKLGKPSVKVAGYTKGNWLKTMDKFTENADGTCTRNEQWTYTPDIKHSWIYDELDI